MSELALYRYELTGIDCADCAAKLEAKLKQIEGISDVSLSFLHSSLTYVCDHGKGGETEAKVRAVIREEEPDAVLKAKGHSHLHPAESHEHEHEHEHENEHEEHCGCHAHEADHEERALYRYELTGIDCADCAAKLEAKLKQIEGISDVSLSFLHSSLTYVCDHDKGGETEAKVRALIREEEPDAVLKAKGHSHLHTAENHEHEHQHDHERSESACGNGSCRLSVTGIDCADCAASLERKIARLNGISNVRLSFMNSTLTYDCEDPAAAERAIRELVAKEEPDATVSAYEQSAVSESQADSGKKTDVMLVRLIIGGILFLAGLFTEGTLQTALEITSYLVLGYDVLLRAVKGIGRGQVFDEHFLMSVATLAAMYLKDFREAAGVMLFYQIGEYFQDRAVASSRRSIAELMDIRPDTATVKRNGVFEVVSPEEVRPGEIILVKPGERIPLDGVVSKGSSSLNTASLTGESKLRDVDEGDEVISGSVNENGLLEIRVTKEYGESTVARILNMVENQDTRKADAENFITGFSRVYTPAVVGSAILTAIAVSLLTGDVNEGIYRACTFLVISCPCALVISVPLSFFAGIGGLSRAGILVKGANMIEPLARTSVAVMDKTGTLTEGVLAVSGTVSASNPEETIEDAAYAESSSSHPIAVGIRNAFGKQIDESKISEVNEIAGRGIEVRRGEDHILAGNYRMMKDFGVECTEEQFPDTLVYVAKNGVYEGCIRLSDRIKEDAPEAVKKLKQAGLKTVIVSGDNPQLAERTGNELGIDEVYGGCMPEDKVKLVDRYRKEGITLFAGDGVNDAPVLAAADIGAAMGGLGSDAAIEAADVVIMDDRPSGIVKAVSGAKTILRIVNENLWGAISVKILTLILSAFGIASMWWAIFADTGVAMLCVLNAMRLLRIGTKN